MAEKLENWPDEERVVPENWLFSSADEGDAVLEYGVSGFTGMEKWNIADKTHWMLPLGRILELRSDGLMPHLIGHEIQQQLCIVLAQNGIKKVKMELKFPQSEFDAMRKTLANSGIVLEYCG